MAGRGNHAKSVGILGPPGATTLWASNTSVFAIHHLLSALEALCSFIRVGSQGWVLASVFCVHSVAWFCCQKGRSAERARRLQTVASVCGVLSWSLRTLLHYRWAAGLPVTPLLERVLGSSYVYPAETFMCLLETVHALMLFPSALVSMLLSVHLSVVYSSIKSVQGQPDTVSTILWLVANFVAPHVMRCYLSSTARAQDTASTGVDEKASMCSAAAPPSASPTKRLTDGKAPSQLELAPEPDTEVLVLSDADADVVVVDDATAAAAARKVDAEGPQGTSAGAALPRSSTQASVPSGQRMLSARSGLRALRRHSQQRRSYSSQLVQPKVVIKVKGTEPSQLRSDMTTAVSRALVNQGLSVARACVRKGSTLVVLDLVQPPATRGETRETPVQVDLPIQTWLQSIMASGARILDGAVARIQLGRRHLQAVWSEEQGTWVTTEPAEDLVTPAAPIHLTLLFVDRPIARLPVVTPLSDARISAGLGLHRVSLLLQLQLPAASVTFLGSDQASAQLDQPVDTTQATVQCVARGCWGTCLPVVVAGVDEEAGEETQGGATTVVALTLDVDLSVAPSAGSVQLELWCGRALLASAPLLLLPALTNGARASGSDPLLDELQDHVQQVGWEEEASEPETCSGAAAFLSDLGQVLFSVQCVQQTASDASAQKLSDNSAVNDMSTSGPSSWGGVVMSLASEHAFDPALLSSMHSLGEGLLEYAKMEGLKATASLLNPSILALHLRLEQVQAAEAGPCTTSAGVSLSPPGMPVNSAAAHALAPARIDDAEGGSSATATNHTPPPPSQSGAELRQRQVWKLE